MQTRIFRSSQELDVLHRFWEENQRHPNGDLEYFLTVCDSLEGVISPWVVAILEEGEIRGLIVARVERRAVRPKIGYANLPGLNATGLSVIQGGFVGEFTDVLATAGIDALLAQLDKREFDYLAIHKLPEHCEAVWKALQTRTSGKVVDSALKWIPHRRLGLVGRKPGFLLDQMSSKHRYNTRRQEKKFNETFPDQIEWQWHTDFPDLDDVCSRMEDVASKTYQRGLGAGFVNDEVQRRRISVLTKRGLMRVMLLKVSGNAKAYWLGTAYDGVFHSTSLGYMPDVAAYGVGNLMLFKLVDRLVAEGFTALDFGSGDAEYKERFSDQSSMEADATVYSGRFKSRFLEAYVGAAGRLDGVARSAVARMGALGRLKRRWRDRLADKAARKS